MRRGNGGIIGPRQVSTTTSAPGVWGLFEQQENQGAGIWPSALTTPTVEYLVVAGGGAGGSTVGGGGGAGGYRTATGYAVTAGSAITVTVGAGGPRAAWNSLGSNGSNSVFGTITATGGGTGGIYNSPYAGADGGSGGGGTGRSGVGALGGAASPSGQGNAGGEGVQEAGGGGGGAGQAGFKGDAATTPRKGGDGLNWNSLGTYYAGGGGGCIGIGGTPGAGGAGGGGAGSSGNNSSWNAPTAGTANTGGGGGGNRGDYTPSYGADGGSGIVIIRYADTYPAAASTTGSPTVTTSGGYRYYKFTGSGTITF